MWPYSQVNQSLLDLHAAAGEKGDAHLCDFLEANYLDEQVTNRFSDRSMEMLLNPPFQEIMIHRQTD